MAGVISGQYRSPVVAQTATSGTPLEVLVDEYGRLIVAATVTGGSGTSSNFGAAFPTAGTASGFIDGTSLMQGARVYDLGGGFATENILGTVLRASSMAGSVETGTTTNPLYVGVRSSTVGITLTKGVSATTVTTDHQALDTYTWGGIWIGATGSTLPTNAGLAGFSDGANTRAARVYDLDTDGGTTAYVVAVQLRIPGSGDSVAAQGQKAMASSIPVVIASDQSAVTVTGAFIGATGATVPASAALAGFADANSSANSRAARVYDTDSGGGAEYTLGVNLRLSASGASIEAQGQKAMAASIPVTLASDQSAITISSTARTFVGMTALATNLVISSAAATAYSCAGYIDSTATTGTYFVQLINATAAVDSGGAITPIAIIMVAHTSGITDYFSFAPYLPSQGVTASTGIVVQLSSTLGTGTLAGAFLLASGAK